MKMSTRKGRREDHPMKIWFQKHTIIGRNPWLDEAYEQHAAAVLPPGVQVDFHSLPPEVYEGTLPADYVRFGQLEVLFSWYFADQAVEAERAGYSAFIIGTSQDPGLDMARSLVSIPVVGYGETVFDLLSTQGLRFGVVGFIPALEEILTENLIRNGWHRHCVGFDYIPEGRALVVEKYIKVSAMLSCPLVAALCIGNHVLQIGVVEPAGKSEVRTGCEVFARRVQFALLAQEQIRIDCIDEVGTDLFARRHRLEI